MHDPLGLWHLFQLRVGLSNLRYHKKCHNFFDNPSGKCLCNHDIEDTNHFLFSCPLFAFRRATLAINVIAILQKIQSDSFRKPITPVSICAPHHEFGRQYQNPLVNIRIDKGDSTLFNVSLLPYHIHATVSQSRLSFINSFVSIFILVLYFLLSFVFSPML